jgi:uncharacterized caspase-like protein
MRRIAGIVVLLALTVASGNAHGGQRRASGRRAGESCYTAKDLVVQALERLRADSGSSDLEDADQLLRRAIDLCAESGDAWYYRALIEAKLNRAPQAKYAMGQAQDFGSEALRDGLNPFILATPSSRGFNMEASGKNPQPKATPAPVVPGPVQAKWALVIGISQFIDKGIPSLNFSTQDADAFAAELKDPEIGRFPAENVREITNAEATTKNIKEQLNWIARSAQPNDLVVIYVATHGSPRSLDSVSGVNYLITYDTEMYDGGNFDEDAMYGSALPMVELADAVATRMKALRTLVVLDTCYSGGSIGNQVTANGKATVMAAPSRTMLEQMGQGTGRIVLAASQSDEESLESKKLGHGYFTYYLLEALKSGKGNTPMSQVYAEVSKNVSQLAAESGGRQHPVIYQSSAAADFSIRAQASDQVKTGF